MAAADPLKLRRRWWCPDPPVPALAPSPPRCVRCWRTAPARSPALTRASGVWAASSACTWAAPASRGRVAQPPAQGPACQSSSSRRPAHPRPSSAGPAPPYTAWATARESSESVRSVRIRSTTLARLLHGFVLLPNGISVAGTDNVMI